MGISRHPRYPSHRAAMYHPGQYGIGVAEDANEMQTKALRSLTTKLAVSI